MTEFEQIYRTYFDDIYRYLRRLSGDAQLAEELTSETFFKAMRVLDSFRGDCDIRVWLCQIAKNCYYTERKKAGRTDSLDAPELPELASCEDGVETRCIRRDEASRVRAALHELPEPYKEVFLWRVFAELSFRQIGQLFGKSENWACVTYHRAKARVQRGMEDRENAK